MPTDNAVVRKQIDRRTLWIQRQMRPENRISPELGQVQTHAVAYLRDRHPYVVVFNGEDNGGVLVDPPQERTCARTGWIILDYGIFLCTSAGEQALARYYHDPAITDDENGGEDDGDAALKPPQSSTAAQSAAPQAEAGHTTIAQQAHQAAIGVLELAAEKGWTSVRISEGHDNMKFAIYAESDPYNIQVGGFLASDTDEKKKARLQGLRERRSRTIAKGTSLTHHE